MYRAEWLQKHNQHFGFKSAIRDYLYFSQPSLCSTILSPYYIDRAPQHLQVSSAPPAEVEQSQVTSCEDLDQDEGRAEWSFSGYWKDTSCPLQLELVTVLAVEGNLWKHEMGDRSSPTFQEPPGRAVLESADGLARAGQGHWLWHLQKWPEHRHFTNSSSSSARL